MAFVVGSKPSGTLASVRADRVDALATPFLAADWRPDAIVVCGRLAFVDVCAQKVKTGDER